MEKKISLYMKILNLKKYSWLTSRTVQQQSHCQFRWCCAQGTALTGWTGYHRLGSSICSLPKFHLGEWVIRQKWKPCCCFFWLTSFLAAAPRKAWEVEESLEKVEEGPGDDDDVVDVLEEDHHDGRVADAFEDGRQLADDGHSANAEVLPDGDLEEEEGDATDGHGEEVGDEEGTWEPKSFDSPNKITWLYHANLPVVILRWWNNLLAKRKI